ncbi:AraC family transcriptional regulator [Alteribacillus sp. HJP-4]|uniref:AraC family transcriptional regulator n=1 Tax=Alteribacillus sp. HJP-4 TaxID=2775394 RepID=UPI0035CD0352
MFLKTSVTRPIEFISAGQFMSDESFRHDKRKIDSYELIIGVNKTLYIQQGKEKYEVKPGQALLICPEEVHQGYKDCEEDLSFFWVHFIGPDEAQYIDEVQMFKDISPLRKSPGSRKVNTDVYIPTFSTIQEPDRMNILFRQLLHVDNANYYTRLSANYLLTSLLIELSEQTITNFFYDKNQKQVDYNLVQMMEWTRIHAFEKISVQKVAETFNYNKDYLSRMFKRETGMNLNEYINLLKMSKAKELLSRTNKSIKEIAGVVGLYDEKYFMKLFKKYEGLTPTEYRKAFYSTHWNKK